MSDSIGLTTVCAVSMTIRRLACLGVALVALAGSGALVACSSHGPDTFSVEHNVQYGADGRTELVADVYTPTGTTSRSKHAGIVMVHGGSWGMGDKSELAGTAEGYAAAGFVAVNINYSLPPPGERWPAELEDCEKAVAWVEDNASKLGVDPNRIGAYGSSAGGNLAMMLGVVRDAATIPHPVKAVVSWSGISDISALAPLNGKADPERPPAGCAGQSFCMGLLAPQLFTEYLGCTKAQCPSRYADASPITHVDSQSAPMYLTAATDDYVPFDQCLIMHRALDADGVASEAVSIPGKLHAEQLRPEALAPSIKWFQRQL
jgi:acetyl esterase/lipase